MRDHSRPSPHEAPPGTADDASVPSDEMLVRFLTGTSTPAEAAEVRTYLDTSPTAARLLNRLRELDFGGATVPTSDAIEGRIDDAWTQLHERVTQTARGTESKAREREAWKQKARARETRWMPYPSIIASFVAVLVLLTAGVIAYHIGDAGRHEDSTLATEQQYHTVPGQRSTIHLADGSAILLAPSTSVTVTPTRITIAGQAYLTISPNATHPRIIQTSTAIVHILGTRFSIRHYADETRTRIVVEDGKVAVRTSRTGQDAMLSNHLVVLSAANAALVSDSIVTVERDISVHDALGWTQGRLVFNGTPLYAVIRELSRAYGVEVRLADSTLARRPMTLATSVRDIPLVDVVRQIAFTLDAHVTRDGSALVIETGQHVPKSQPIIRHLPQPEKQYGR